MSLHWAPDSTGDRLGSPRWAVDRTGWARGCVDVPPQVVAESLPSLVAATTLDRRPDPYLSALIRIAGAGLQWRGMASQLLDTKFYGPKPRTGLVPRPGLTERLRRGTQSKLTLISAPAGFGG